MSLSAQPVSAAPAMLAAAARCWRDARDQGKPVQPCLTQVLADYDTMMLAPVMDSLMLFYEGALGRPLRVGEAEVLSADEELLVALIDGTAPRQCLNCVSDAATALNCAVCSTRIMLSMARKPN